MFVSIDKMSKGCNSTSFGCKFYAGPFEKELSIRGPPPVTLCLLGATLCSLGIVSTLL